ncbi:hypothetical protein QFC19_006489 [Naganishia cerealis]|uniref:Uncharacterized protein n=1 Tax=Naganishia cerealis TaxID=610337 RepID=A0ACC2VGD5_9TREE|nr:hypothetical protein QFC19_006489 [Naganishia cerealis]
MSSAPAITAENPPATAHKTAVVVVTPDVIEEPKPSTSEPETAAAAAAATDAVTAAPVAESATAPALELAESAGVVAAKPMAAADAAAPHTNTVESAVKSAPAAVAETAPAKAVVVGDKPHGDAVVFQNGVKVANSGFKEIASDGKGEKKVKKSFISRLSGLFSFQLAPSSETKTSARSTSSSSSDEANASTTNANKPLPTIVATPSTPTVTPATPSKTASPDAIAGTSTPAVVPAAAPASAAMKSDPPLPSKAENEVDAIAERVEKIELHHDVPDFKGKQAEKPVVPTKKIDVADEGHVVKETHPAPATTNAVLEASPTSATTEDKKAESPAAASPKIHRRISARIGQFIDHKFSHEKKKTPSSPAAAAAAGSDVVTSEQGPGKDKESFVSGSAEPGVPLPATAAAAHESVAAAPPVLGEPIKVEPMGELVAEVEDAVTAKPVDVDSESVHVVKPAVAA